jgi:hypothetical protein
VLVVNKRFKTNRVKATNYENTNNNQNKVAASYEKNKPVLNPSHVERHCNGDIRLNQPKRPHLAAG